MWCSLRLICADALTPCSCLPMDMLHIGFWLYGQSKSILFHYPSKCRLKLIGKLACWLRVGIKCCMVFVRKLLDHDTMHTLGCSWEL